MRVLCCFVLLSVFLTPLSMDAAPRGARVQPGSLKERMEKQKEAESWRLVWADEFNGLSLDTKKWNIEVDFVRNVNAQQLYTDRRKNIRLDKGMLVFEAHAERAENRQYDPESKSWLKNRRFADYTSGSVNSSGKFAFRYGKVDIRAKLQHGKGVWPALWMLGEAPGKGWPDCGEIDILEYISQQKHTVHGTLHWEQSSNTLGAGRTKNIAVPSLLDGFHTYGLEWDKDTIRLLFDGEVFHTFAVADAQNGDYNPFRNRYHFILNLAVGGWAERADPKDYPRRFVIDYIRVWQKKDDPESKVWINGRETR